MWKHFILGGSLGGRTDGRMDGWTDGRMDGWTDGRMDSDRRVRRTQRWTSSWKVNTGWEVVQFWEQYFQKHTVEDTQHKSEHSVTQPTTSYTSTHNKKLLFTSSNDIRWTLPLTSFVSLLVLRWEGLPEVATSQAGHDGVCTGAVCRGGGGGLQPSLNMGVL